MFDLTGKTALVTGSARGIGFAVAAAMKQAGANVILHGATESEHLKKAAQTLASPYAAADLGNEEELSVLCEKVPAADILVLNGSVQSYTGLENFSLPEFSRMMDTNVASTFRLLAHFVPKMAEKGFGRIIGVSSINQVRPAPRLAVYSATKAALANIMAMTAKRYAADGVTANTILPGVIRTDRNREALKDEEFAAKLLEDIPAHRFGTPEDCAPLAVFLASDEAAYITGAEIPAAGGWQL